jgi:hypothetical protein
MRVVSERMQARIPTPNLKANVSSLKKQRSCMYQLIQDGSAKNLRYCPPVVGDMLDISAMDAMAVRNPKKAPRYTQIAPALPPLRMANCDALNCASHVAISTIVKPKIVRKRKLRYGPVRLVSLENTPCSKVPWSAGSYPFAACQVDLLQFLA